MLRLKLPLNYVPCLLVVSHDSSHILLHGQKIHQLSHETLLRGEAMLTILSICNLLKLRHSN